MAMRSPKFRYHAVSVVTGARPCAAAEALHDVYMLSEEAPRLPLAECDHPRFCKCTYRHHDERRGGPRRAADSGLVTQHWLILERRSGQGRRASD